MNGVLKKKEGQSFLTFLILMFSFLGGRSLAADHPNQLFLAMISNESKPPELIYRSSNLESHSLFAECNPGGTSHCPCDARDAAIQSFDSYGEVTSNPRQINTYVNAIGYKKFIETYPNGASITLHTAKYRGQIRLPVLPEAKLDQIFNPQAVHFMIQLWDGRNALFIANKHSREAVIYWDLNPWEGSDYGKIKIYTYPLNLIDTGLKLTPDTEWHSFELVVDLSNRKYISISIDGITRDLKSYDMAAVYHPDWGPEVALSITTESMASWPGASCDYPFTWTTQFRNLEFFEIK